MDANNTKTSHVEGAHEDETISEQEMIYRLNKMPEPRMRSNLDDVKLADIERKEMNADNVVSASHYNAMKRIGRKFLSLLMASENKKFIGFTDVVNDVKGYETYRFFEYFKGDPSLGKKEDSGV